MSRDRRPSGQEFRALLQIEAEKTGLELPPATLDRIADHYRLLAKWNPAVRLIGTTEPRTVIGRHVLESLQLVPFIHEPRGSLLDVGSGNGYPALPIKCLYSELRVGMIESTRRKATFLRTVVAELDLPNVEVFTARIHRPRDLERLGRWDCVSMRAVSAIRLMMEAAPRILRPSGRLLFMVGQAGRDEVLSRLGGGLDLMADHRLPESRASYIIAVQKASSEGSDDTIH